MLISARCLKQSHARNLVLWFCFSVTSVALVRIPVLCSWGLLSPCTPVAEPVPGPCTTVGKMPASFLVLRLLESWGLGAPDLSRAGAPGSLTAVWLQSVLVCVLSSLEELQKAPAPWSFPVF